MNVSELLGLEFTLRDGLTGADVLTLEQVRGTLDTSTPRLADGADEASERAHEAQYRALQLFEATHDLQAWVVLVQVFAQSGVAEGVFIALQLVNKGLGQAWDGLQNAAEQAREPNKAVLRLGRHVDGLLGRLYEYLAYLQERSPEHLLRSVEGDEGTWATLLQAIEHRLNERKLSGANWESLKDILQKNIARRERQESLATSVPSTEPTTVPDATGAAESSTDSSAGVAPALGAVDPPKTAWLGPLLEDTDRVTLRVSKEFIELCRRLEAFQILLGRKDFEKAALVASELSEGLTRFDVTSLFPDLFAGLFQGQVDYAVELEPYSMRGDGMRERSLKQLYRTALDRFLGEGLGSGNHGR